MPLNRLSAQHYRFLQQWIVLTGLGSPTFTRAFEAAVEIYGYFDHQFSEGILESWMASQDSELDAMPCFDISNRYLTPTKETKDLDIPFKKGVDPWGILRGMASGNGTCTYVHTEDNQVQYFTTSREASSNRKSVEARKEYCNNVHHQLTGFSHANHRHSGSEILSRLNCLL